MGVFDAQTAQSLATRHKRSISIVVDGLRTVNVLMAKIIEENKIKWGGYGTNFTWNIRKADESATWSTGQLGTRTFEEIDPVTGMTLPYCYIEKTYGVGEKSLKSNRAAGENKIFDIQKENARAAQTALYKALAAGIYSNGSNSLQPVGLAAMVGDAYSSSSTNGSDRVTVSAGKTYAGKTLNTSAVTNHWATYAIYKAIWDNWFLYPTVVTPQEISGTAPAWSTGAIDYLSWMENMMTFASDISGTGDVIKPDMALMNKKCYQAMVKILTTSQKTYNVPLGNKAAYLAKFPNIRVGDLDCVQDDNVPLCSRPADRVFVLDSNQLWAETYNTKAEGLIESEFSDNDPNIRGAVGVYKMWFAMAIQTNKAIGAIVGCDD